MVQEAADLAKKRREEMVAGQQKRVSQLESLRALIRKKEEEVSRKSNHLRFPNNVSTASRLATGQAR